MLSSIEPSGVEESWIRDRSLGKRFQGRPSRLGHADVAEIDRGQTACRRKGSSQA